MSWSLLPLYVNIKEVVQIREQATETPTRVQSS